MTQILFMLGQTRFCRLFASPSELEKKREAKQREREAREKEARKREKAEEKERRRMEYNAQVAAAASREQQKKKSEEKKKKNAKAAGGTLKGRVQSSLCVCAGQTGSYSLLRKTQKMKRNKPRY